MVYIGKNIWKLFAITMVIGLFILCFVTYRLWSQIHLEYKTEQENITRILKNSTTAMLSQYEVTLDVLGEFLLKDKVYKNTIKSKKILKHLLKINPTIAAFGLVNPSGDLYVTSIDKNVNKLPNLFNKKETRESFKKVLVSDSMILGRTYYHDTLNTYIVPIRKVIKDTNSKILGVMTAGIKVDEWYASIGEGQSNHYESFLFREFDSYFQLVPSMSKYKNDLYGFPFSVSQKEKLAQAVFKKYNISFSELKKSNKIISLKLIRNIDNIKVFSSLSYIPKYNLWTIVETKYENILNEFYKVIVPVYIVCMFIGLLLYYLFYQLSSIALKNRKALEYQAEHDYLTKINNRFFLSKMFHKKNFIKPFTLIVINIDNFKNINKNYGHSYGDLTLKEISVRLAKIKEEDDILVRYSGDEFLFIRQNIGEKHASLLAQKIINSLYEPYNMKKIHFILGSSLGIASYPNDGKDFDEVKKYADISLQEAKKKKNTYMFFEDSIKLKYLRLSVIEQELKIALENDEIYMMYQPQVREDGFLYGVEALVRWKNKELGNVPPDEFIEIAEQTGMMEKLGRYIVETSLQEISKMQKLINKKFQLSINISLKQFIVEDCYETLFKAIDNAGFDKSYLTLEVTEKLFIEDIDFILTLLKKIQKQGIKISLDDFGTGYSSFSLLKKLPINELKIDKSFIDDITTDEDSKNMVESIILIGKQLNMSILAEGIEFEEQRDVLHSCNCDLYQGYNFSRPLKVDKLIKYIQEHEV